MLEYPFVDNKTIHDIAVGISPENLDGFRRDVDSLFGRTRFVDSLKPAPEKGRSTPSDCVVVGTCDSLPEARGQLLRLFYPEDQKGASRGSQDHHPIRRLSIGDAQPVEVRF